MFSCESCEIYKNTFYYRTPPVAASGVLINFAILEPFFNKVAGLFKKNTYDGSFLLFTAANTFLYLLLTVASVFENKS